MGVSSALLVGTGVYDLILNSKLASKDGEIEGLMKAIKQKDDELVQLRESNKRLAESNRNLTIENYELRSNNTELEMKISGLEIVVKSLTATIEENKKTIANLTAFIAQQDAEILYLNGTVSIYKRVLEIKNEDIRQLEIVVAQKNITISALNAANMLLRKTAENLQGALAQKTMQLSGMSISVSLLQKAAAITDLVLTQKNMRISALTATNALLKNVTEGLLQVVSDQKLTIAGMSTRILQLSFQNSELTATETLLRQIVHLQDAMIAERDKTIVGQATTIKARDASLVVVEIEKTVIVKAMKAAAESFEDIIGQLKEQIKGWAGKVEQLTAQIVELNKKIAELTKNIADLTTENTGLKATIVTLNEKIANLTRIVNALGEQVKKFDDTHATCQTAWLQYNILAQNCSKQVVVTKVFSASGDSCTTTNVRKAIATVAPGYFVAREKDTNLQFGGYTTQTFDNSDVWKADANAFTFSLSTFNKCKITAEGLGTAIYASEEYGSDRDVVGFGKWDIWVPDECLSEPTLIGKHSTYACPTNEHGYFYTDSEKPTLVAFDYYKVELKSLKK